MSMCFVKNNIAFACSTRFVRSCRFSYELLHVSMQRRLRAIESGEADMVIATHVVIQENVIFHDLGLVITDEQHRFGVEQRRTLSSKGENEIGRAHV